MGLIDDNLNWDVTITNNGINNYFENITNTTIPVGATETLRVGSTLLADQIIYNARQRNELKKVDFILVTKQAVNQSTGANYNYLVNELDLIASAEKVFTTMHLTPDLDNYIQGNNSVGEVKTAEIPPPELFYDAYTLSNAQNMLMQPDNMFVPDQTNNPIAFFSGDIDALAASQYKINLGDQQHTFIHFKNSQTNQILEIHIDNELRRVQNGLEVAVFPNEHVNNIIFAITEQNSVRILGWNDTVNVNPNNSALPVDYDTISIKVAKTDGVEVVEHTTDQFVQVVRGTNLVELRPISAFFKVFSGKFKLSVDSSTDGALYLFNRDTQPTEKLTYSDVAQKYLNNYAIGIQSIGNGNLFLLVGKVTGSQPAFNINIVDAVGTEEFSFEFLSSSTIDIYRKDIKIGTALFEQDFLPYLQTVCEFPSTEFESFSFDFSESYELLDYKLPESAADGDIFHLTTGGTLFNKVLLPDDYITVYGNKTNIAINRLPKIPIRKSLPVYSNSNSLTTQNVYAIYDEQLGKITLGGEYYNGGLDVGLMFYVDISSIENDISARLLLPMFVEGSTNFFNIEKVEGRLNFTSTSNTYGQNMIVGSIVAEVSA